MVRSYRSRICRKITQKMKDNIDELMSKLAGTPDELLEELKNGTIVNPSLRYGEHGKTVLVDNDVRMMERLNFDIAVTATDKSEVNGKAKVGISVFGAKIGTENTEKTENVSRLSFSIPILLPATHVKTSLEKAREGLRRPQP